MPYVAELTAEQRLTVRRAIRGGKRERRHIRVAGKPIVAPNAFRAVTASSRAAL